MRTSTLDVKEGWVGPCSLTGIIVVCVSSLVIDEIKRIIKSSEILKYVPHIATNGGGG